MTKRERIESSVREFIINEFPAARKRGLGNRDSLLERGLVDSLGVMEIVSFIEQEFGLTLSDEEMTAEHFDSIASIAALIEEKGAAEGAAWTT